MHVAFIVQCELTSRCMRQCNNSKMWQGYLLCFVFGFWRKQCKWFHWSHNLVRCKVGTTSQPNVFLSNNEFPQLHVKMRSHCRNYRWHPFLYDANFEETLCSDVAHEHYAANCKCNGGNHMSMEETTICLCRSIMERDAVRCKIEALEIWVVQNLGRYMNMEDEPITRQSLNHLHPLRQGI